MILTEGVFIIEGGLDVTIGHVNGEKAMYMACDKEMVLVSRNQLYPSGTNLDIEEIYHGSSHSVPSEILDSFLISADSSANPLRPFRYYKYMGNEFADTNEPTEIIRMRYQSFERVLDNIRVRTPEPIWLYKAKIK